MPTPSRRLTSTHWAASAAMLIAAFLAARWIFQWEFANFIPGVRETGIVSSTLMFVVGAAVLRMTYWPEARAPSSRVTQRYRGLALLLATMPVLMLFEAFSGISLGVDIARASVLPTALSPHPGRISPNACIVFMLLAASLAALAGDVTPMARRWSAGLIGAAVMVSTLGIFGYLLHLEALYRWGSFNRLTLPTATGLTLLAIALWQQRQAWTGEAQRIDRHEQRIGQRSLGVLAVVAVASGAGGFAVLQSDLERARAEDLRSTSIVTAESMTSALDTAVWLSDTISTRQVVIEALARVDAAPADPRARERLRVLTQSLLTGGITAARFIDPAGRLLADAGTFAVMRDTPALSLSRDYATTTRLIWKDGFILQSEQAVAERGEVLGLFISEHRLTLMDRVVARIRDSDPSADVLICSRVVDAASCVPSKLYPRPFTIPMFDANGRVNLPINRALLGESGVVLTPDLRGVAVVAAFTPLDRTGLAMVVKSDIEAVYSTIRQRLGWLLVVLTVLVLAGTWVLRRHVRPLVRQLAAGEQRMRDVANAIPAVVAAFDRDERCIFANDLAMKMHNVRSGRAVGLPMRKGLGEESYALHRPYISGVLDGQQQSFEISLPWQGSLGHFQVNFVPMRDSETQDVAGFYVMTFDVTELRRAQLKQERSERRLRSITDSLPALISHLDADGRYLFANRQFETLLGIRPEELLGHRIDEVRDRFYVDQIMPRLREAMAGRTVVFEAETGPANGPLRKYQQTYVPEFDAGGRVVGVFAVTFDITERKLAEQRVSDAQAQLKAIADNLPVLISYIDRNHRLTYANATYKDWMGVDPEMAAGTHLSILAGPTLYAQRVNHIEQALRGERVEFEVVSLALGVTRHLNTLYIPDRREDGSVQGVYALSTDITVMKDVERRLEDLARNDSLTGLPNRREFESRLGLALARSRRQRRLMALIFMDVDRFKSINDTHGHAAGDAVLKEFAARILGTVRGTDTAARLAGDEFVVILEGLQNADEASHVAAKLVDAVRAPMQLPSGEILTVTTSIGVACYGGVGDGAEDILERADRALYRAKAAGRDTFAQTNF